MILDQCLFGLLDGFLHSLKLLSDVQAGSPLLDHLHDAAEVAACAAQSLDDRRMCLMNMHDCELDRMPPGGI